MTIVMESRLVKKLSDWSINDFDIQALVDGELSGERAALVRHRISIDSALAERYERLLALRTLLRSAYRSAPSDA